MPRRASSGLSLTHIALIVLVAAGIVSAGYFGLKISGIGGGDDSDFRGVTEFQVADYLQNANSLRGNVYRLTGVIEDQLKWTAGNGRLLSVKTQGSPVAIKIPPDFANLTIEGGEEFLFKVEVHRDGLLVARALKKI